MMKRLSTGIRRLDEILHGGIPEGHVVLLPGASGTGKTILGLQFLFTGAALGEKGIYVCHTEEESSIIKNLEELSFYDHKYIESGLVRIVDSSNFQDASSLKSVNLPGAMGVFEELLVGDAKRVVIDSITSICDLFNQDRFPMRSFVFGLRKTLKARGLTALLLSEVPPLQTVYSRYGFEEFISDGIILLQDVPGNKQMKRMLVVMKMRGMSHSRDYHALVISQEGINLEPLIG
jgi:circadian clock protein KaiC